MKKDYLKLFLKYAKDNSLWFSIYGDGSIDCVTDTDAGSDFLLSRWLKLGSKAAYDWLIKEHKAILKEANDA